jgi:hypothetical protein
MFMTCANRKKKKKRRKLCQSQVQEKKQPPKISCSTRKVPSVVVDSAIPLPAKFRAACAPFLRPFSSFARPGAIAQWPPRGLQLPWPPAPPTPWLAGGRDQVAAARVAFAPPRFLHQPNVTKCIYTNMLNLTKMCSW